MFKLEIEAIQLNILERNPAGGRAVEKKGAKSDVFQFLRALQRILCETQGKPRPPDTAFINLAVLKYIRTEYI